MEEATLTSLSRALGPLCGCCSCVGDARVLAALSQVPVPLSCTDSELLPRQLALVSGAALSSEMLEWVGGFPSLPPSANNSSEMGSARFLGGVGGSVFPWLLSLPCFTLPTS